jgi:hypothetical protein
MGESQKKFHKFSAASRQARTASILQIREILVAMKSPLRISASILATAFFLPVNVLATTPQPVAQDQEGGMGGFQMAEHSVRGDVTAISGNSITVKTDEGDYTIATGPNTRFRKQRDEVKLTDLHVGDMIAAVGDKDPKAKTVGAMFVIVIDRQQYEKARADFGKTWTAGVVQSIDGTNIVIKRVDNVTQTIAVDENTGFRHRREDITLADIKPGDHIGARGALQNGTFLATEVSIGGPGGSGGGHGNWSGQPNSATDASTPLPNP